MNPALPPASAILASLGQAAFFRVFDRAVMPADSVDVVSAWTVEGVDWTRRRFSPRKLRGE